jgi:hypothetical protein
MLTGWRSLLRNPRGARPESVGSVGDFVLIQPAGAKGASLVNGEVVEKRSGVLPSPEKERMNAPEPGDVSQRHETTNLFEDSDGDDEQAASRRPKVDHHEIV